LQANPYRYFQSFNISRYGRVQSIKIITTTTTSTSQSGAHSNAITSTTAPSTNADDKGLAANGTEQISSSLSSLQHSSNNQNIPHNTNNATAITTLQQQHSAIAGAPNNNSDHSSINQISNSHNNSSNINHNIGVCATIAFMDIKSASKAHTAEHKFDDRILTTEYYEPATLLCSSLNGDDSIHSISSTAVCPSSGTLVGIDGSLTSNTINSRLEQIHNSGRYTSSSSHGLVFSS
jgi:hypothetical protein